MPKSLKPFLFLFLILSLAETQPAYGFDGSDAEIPRIEQISLANTSVLKPNEPIAVILKTSDDKNWVKIDGTLNIGYSYKLLPGRNTPPNCSTVTTAFSKLEAVEILSQRSTASNARKSQTFWLVGFLPAKKELVSNCAEYRDLTQAPVVIVNSSSFKSVTPRGFSTPIVSGGIYLPKITDESGRSAPTALTQRMQESQFLPGLYNFAPTISCLTYADSFPFKAKNQVALDQFELEVMAARDLINTEGIEIANQALSLLKQVDAWLEFARTPSLETLKSLPSCVVPNSTILLMKALNEARIKLKASNTLVSKSNLEKRCEIYVEKYLELEKKVISAREQFKGTKMRDDFLRFSYSSLKVNCASILTTELLLTSREGAFQVSEEEFSGLEQEALDQVFCKPFKLQLKSLKKSYTKASLKYSGSRYEKFFPTQNLEDSFGACALSPLNRDSIQSMTSDFGIFTKNFNLRLNEAERLLKAQKLTFNVTCSKGVGQRQVINKTGQCPKGFIRIFQPAAN